MAIDRWFRFYEEAINDDKVLTLPSDTLRWQWVVLLVVNSKYGGHIPSLEIAATNLRISKPKAAQVIAALHRAELLDPVDGGYFAAHNWKGRQPTDATAAERKRRQRQKERDEKQNERDCHGVTTVTGHAPVTPTEIIGKTDDDEDAREALISEGAHRIATEVAKIAGHDPEFIPPSWFWAPYRAQQWLNQGWPEELILLSAKEQAAKKRDGPAKSINYFEPGIASAIAKANQPLPKVVEIKQKTVEVVNGKSSLIAAADNLINTIEGWGSARAAETSGRTDAPFIRLLPEGRCERPGDLHIGGGGSAGGIRAGGDLQGDGPAHGAAEDEQVSAKSG